MLADVEEHKRSVGAAQREREADFQATEAALRSEVQELTSDLAVARAVDDLGELVALFKRK